MIPKIDHKKIEKCAACGAADTEGFVVCSSFGASSFPLCLRCIYDGRDVYMQMVDYIANAGYWPDDINTCCQEEVRRQLKLYNKTEEEFAADVENTIAFERAIFRR